jgi:hypothetical protein
MMANTFLLMLSDVTLTFLAIGTSMVIFGQSFAHGTVDFSSNVSFSNESSFLQLVKIKHKKSINNEFFISKSVNYLQR